MYTIFSSVIKATLFLLVLVVPTSCSTIRGSVNYTQGTQFLQQGDFDNAIYYLESAVEQDPESGRNHTNLSAAYIQKGYFDKAWIQLRKSISSKYPDENGALSFNLFCPKYLEMIGLDKPGTARKDIEDKLGAPDMILSGNNQYVYGLCVMTFHDDTLQKIEYL